jgi:hypothetical protein
MKGVVQVLMMMGITGCGGINYEVDSLNEDIETPPEEEDTGAVEWDTGIVEEEEHCNGVDDNGNGLIDEGFPDFDEDGVADCTDKLCEVVVQGSTPVAMNEECSGGKDISVDPWDLIAEWHWSGVSTAPAYNSVINTPIIANLTDDDGDGDIDDDDTPDVIFVATAEGLGLLMPGYLVVLDGATGTEHWTSLGFVGFIQPSVVDVDGDGWPEILLAGKNAATLTLLDYTGDELWSTAVGSGLYSIVTDLENDGDVEIIHGASIIDATTGRVEQTIPSTYGNFQVVGDIDQDGLQDLVFSDGVWDGYGAKMWEHKNAGSYAFPTIVDIDGDPGGEVVLVMNGTIRVYDDDGTELWDAPNDSPDAVWIPCAGDFDGDGDVEIAWADKTHFNMYELDGTKRWAMPIRDSSGASSCSTFDFDADGAYEIVYADEDTLWMFDGRTGAVRFTDGSHGSGTLVEYPSIGDVDGDGSVEIISPSTQFAPLFTGSPSGTGGITAYGHIDDGWASAEGGWNAYDYAQSNYHSDSTVFSTTAPWQTHNLVHGKPPVGGSLTDIHLGITDVCVSACDPPGVVRLAVQVANEGGRAIHAGVPIALYADNSGVLELIDVQYMPTAIESGFAPEGFVFEFPYESWGTDGVVARVGEDWSTSLECDEENNIAEWRDAPCP